MVNMPIYTTSYVIGIISYGRCLLEDSDEFISQDIEYYVFAVVLNYSCNVAKCKSGENKPFIKVNLQDDSCYMGEFIVAQYWGNQSINKLRYLMSPGSILVLEDIVISQSRYQMQHISSSKIFTTFDPPFYFPYPLGGLESKFIDISSHYEAFIDFIQKDPILSRISVEQSIKRIDQFPALYSMSQYSGFFHLEKVLISLQDIIQGVVTNRLVLYDIDQNPIQLILGTRQIYMKFLDGLEGPLQSFSSPSVWDEWVRWKESISAGTLSERVLSPPVLKSITELVLRTFSRHGQGIQISQCSASQSWHFPRADGDLFGRFTISNIKIHHSSHSIVRSLRATYGTQVVFTASENCCGREPFTSRSERVCMDIAEEGGAEPRAVEYIHWSGLLQMLQTGVYSDNEGYEETQLIGTRHFVTKCALLDFQLDPSLPLSSLINVHVAISDACPDVLTLPDNQQSQESKSCRVQQDLSPTYTYKDIAVTLGPPSDPSLEIHRPQLEKRNRMPSQSGMNPSQDNFGSSSFASAMKEIIQALQNELEPSAVNTWRRRHLKLQECTQECSQEYSEDRIEYHCKKRSIRSISSIAQERTEGMSRSLRALRRAKTLPTSILSFFGHDFSTGRISFPMIGPAYNSDTRLGSNDSIEDRVKSTAIQGIVSNSGVEALLGGIPALFLAYSLSLEGNHTDEESLGGRVQSRNWVGESTPESQDNFERKYRSRDESVKAIGSSATAVVEALINGLRNTASCKQDVFVLFRFRPLYDENGRLDANCILLVEYLM